MKLDTRAFAMLQRLSRQRFFDLAFFVAVGNYKLRRPPHSF